MVIYTDRPYDGKTLFDYLKVGLVPLNGDFVPVQKAGKTIIYALDEAEDFYTQVGKNTNYLIHPEEIMADNFAFTLIGKKDLANPEIIQNVQKVLKAKIDNQSAFTDIKKVRQPLKCLTFYDL